MSGQAEEQPLTFSLKWIPPASIVADFAEELPGLVAQLPGTVGQMIDAAGEIVVPRQRDREAGG